MRVNKKSCLNCLYYDQCPSPRPCQHYYPVDEDGEPAEEIIESRRSEFYREWELYVAEV